MRTIFFLSLLFSSATFFGQQAQNSNADTNNVLTGRQLFYFDSLFAKTNPPLEFKDQKIAFVVHRPELKIISKKDFLKNYIEPFIASKTMPHLTIQVPTKDKKEEFGGYDYIFLWPTGGLTKKENNKLIRQLNQKDKDHDK